MTIDAPQTQACHRLERIILHWSAGRHWVSSLDRDHYHEIVSGFGHRIKGTCCPEDNLDIETGAYAAHTKDLNVGSIGLCVAGMLDAQYHPYDPGVFEVRTHQLEVFCQMVAEYCIRYDIPVTRQTVLTHAEVQPVLGVAQRGKWDIVVLPGMTCLGDPVEIGDELRRRIAQQHTRLQATA